MTDDSAAAAAASGGSSEVDDDARVLDWELGLPSADDLTPLSQSLIPPSLASAFSIAPEPQRTALDVHRASHSTVSALRRHHSLLSPAPFKPFHHDPILTDDPDPDSDPNLDPGRPDPNLNPSRLEDEAAAAADEDPAGPALKRPRLVWTPQLHKRFVDVVAHLGVKNAVPKTIMQMMNVEGLTRENVASHLQKYRMFLKKSQGMPGSTSDNHHHHHLFASMTPQSDLFAGMIPMPAFGHYGAYGAFGEKLNSGGSSWSMPSYHRATSGGK